MPHEDKVFSGEINTLDLAAQMCILDKQGQYNQSRFSRDSNRDTSCTHDEKFYEAVSESWDSEPSAHS